MDRRNLNWITWGFVMLAVVVMALMLGGSLRRSTHITLPASGEGQSRTEESQTPSGGALTLVEIRPDTVQSAIASLSRPVTYCRTVTAEQFWSGGSGYYETFAAVSGPWTRTDRTLPDGQTRHALTNGEETYIWYNDGTEVFAAPAEGISGDDEQSIPTYEEILELPTESIVEADYQVLQEMNCIYVETAEDMDGYALRYWVSVRSGLLVAAEKLLAGEIIYRMSAPEGEETEPVPSDFTLPDGRMLLDME